MSLDAGTILDFIILILLCVTIFYAAKLSVFLNNFREGRSEFFRLMNDLGQNIQNAEKVIRTLRETSDTSGKSLHAVVKDAQFLSDELRFMNETGDGLAARLEKLAERNRELVNLLENAGGIGVAPPVQERPPVRSRIPPEEVALDQDVRRGASATEKHFFAIHDRDIERQDYDDGEDSLWEDEEETLVIHEPAPQFHSQAEREFYEAMQKGRDKARGKNRSGGIS